MTTQWREKYLVALEEQERLEKQVAAHADMLRRTVMHLSAASDGLDKTLDTEITLFKEKLRGASGLSVNEQLTRVEQAVKKWHNERASQTRTTCELLKTFASEFENLRLDSDTQQNINSFKRSLSPQNVELYKQFDWLKNLLTLHNQAITVAAAPDKNLWQRLSGGKRLVAQAQTQTSELEISEKSAAASNKANLENTTTLENKTTPENTTTPPNTAESLMHKADAAIDEKRSHSVNIELKSPKPNNIKPIDDPGYVDINVDMDLNNKGEIEQLLHEIFSAIVPTEELAESITDERQRIDQGVTGQNIHTFLRAIRDILQASYMNYGAEFSHYLMHMNAELARICQAMDSHLEDTARQMIEREKDTQTLEQSQNKLAKANQKTDINELKDAVMEHLSVIEKSLAQRKNDQNTCEENTKTLQQVAQTLQSVEVEAKATQSLLEKEQHQANRDALTNLPNRTGCSLRLEQECDRFQRYLHPVTLGICNIDGLAAFNEYGYIIGDRVIKVVAKTLRERLRSVDFVGRYHGDKFLLILPEVAPEEGKMTLEKISHFLAKTPLNIKGKPVQVTLSFSVTRFQKKEHGIDSLNRMMDAFGEIKKEGGNCIRVV